MLADMHEALCLDCCSTDLFETTCPHCGSRRRITHPELTDLQIAHIDCDAFYAAVEKRDRPELRDKALIIGHTGGRGVVTTACYNARRFGVRSAMPMFKALRDCPDAVVLPPDMAKYKRVSAQIREIFLAVTPEIEPLSLDEAYLDLSHDNRLSDANAAAAAAHVAGRVEREVGITVSIGLSCNKFLAKLASDMNKPRGFSIIGQAEARQILAPLPIRKIHGVGEATASRLEQSGIMTIRDLQAVSESELVTRFGRFGRRLSQYAHGRDDRKVTSHRASKSISAETTFREDTGSFQKLQDACRPMCERVADQLKRKKLAGGTIVLKLKTSDFRILTRNRRLPNPTQRSEVLFENVETLLAKETDGRTFRLVGIGVSGLSPAEDADPPDLFDVLD